MATDKDTKAELRQQAEKRWQARLVDGSAPGTEYQTQKLVHELEVHQIELEMQNAELLKSRIALETALEKYTDLYDFAPVGYLTLERDGRITEANLAIATLLVIARSQLVGKRFTQFVAPEARATFTTFLNNAFASHTTESWEGPLLGKRRPPLFVHIEALSGNSGEECRAAIIDISLPRQLRQELAQTHDDISILQQIQQELTQTHADLAEHVAQLKVSNTKLEDFSFTVSHDLKGPLVTISSAVELLELELGNETSETAHSCMDFIRKAGRKMNELIEDLLEWSRTGRTVNLVDNVSLAAVTAEAVELLHGQIDACTADIRISDSLPLVKGDSKRLRELMQNLIENAIKYTNPLTRPLVEIGEENSSNGWTFYVRDNGIGIPAAHHEKVFGLFERLHTDREGSGIGLAIVRRIVEEHGGRVWVESAGEGHGSTFFFTLPTGSPCSSTSPEVRESHE